MDAHGQWVKGQITFKSFEAPYIQTHSHFTHYIAANLGLLQSIQLAGSHWQPIPDIRIKVHVNNA